MLNILIAGELHPAGLKIINQNSKYSVDYLKDSTWIHMPFEKYEVTNIKDFKF